ncbi:creatininase family protein [Streptomyces sp. A7024]|uniref:Creatininase family protein n=2 Tax=Streptomyces coryli TaxID=1128680 RepID=A0A6G4U5M1_9ACTN|nr:creatininase family protein [Streptomyces coryli]NGN67006.1 creatininase family protein [Streptomyces coryli]
MTTVEAAAAVARSPLVILPAGAYEQHGPGMPLATDTLRAEAVAERVAAELGGRAVIGPSLPVGVSPHHLGFAGTVTLTTGTLAAVVRDYVGSLHRHGWRKFLVITGHGGNNATLTTVAQDLLADRPDVEFAWTPVTVLASEVVAEMGVSEVHGHSGEAETAQMLHLAPQLVHRERLVAGTTAHDQLDPLSKVARRGGHPTLTLPYDRLSPNGVLGDPRTATPEDGAAIVAAVVTRITAFAKEWLDS